MLIGGYFTSVGSLAGMGEIGDEVTGTASIHDILAEALQKVYVRSFTLSGRRGAKVYSAPGMIKVQIPTCTTQDATLLAAQDWTNQLCSKWSINH